MDPDEPQPSSAPALTGSSSGAAAADGVTHFTDTIVRVVTDPGVHAMVRFVAEKVAEAAIAFEIGELLRKLGGADARDARSLADELERRFPGRIVDIRITPPAGAEIEIRGSAVLSPSQEAAVPPAAVPEHDDRGHA
jgi:L-alanine-DL-glutamate epimerase-like enolase superfamily enzyme